MSRRFILGWVLGGAALSGCVPGGAIAQPGASSCPTVPCSDGVHFATELLATAAEAAGLEITLCHNQLCSTLHPTADGLSFACDFAGPLTAACRISPSGSRLHLEVMFHGTMTGWADGDRFAVRVGLPEVPPLVDVQRAVTYTVSHPAGPDCPPVCQSASLGS